MADGAVCHLNFIGFRAAVAAARDKALRGRPFVIAGAGGGGWALDCSPEALRQGVAPGMAVHEARRRVETKASALRALNFMDAADDAAGDPYVREVGAGVAARLIVGVGVGEG